GSRRDVLWRGVDPAPINVDCPGPVREDVPSHSLLGEGLTGENDRLKRGLQRRTPAIPGFGLGSHGGGFVAPPTAPLSSDAPRVECVSRLRGDQCHFPFCPCGL